MSLIRLPSTAIGQWVASLTAYALLVSSSGCGGLSVSDLPSDGLPLGVFVNTDTSKDLIGGVRLRSEEAVYAYGTFTEQGTVGELKSTVFTNAQGQTATLHFDGGWPTRAVGFDGSTLAISYQEVNSQRLRGQVVYTPGGGGGVQSAAFDVDLQQTAEQVAALVEQLTGLQISSDAPPSSSSRVITDNAKAGGSSLDPTRRITVQVFVVPVAIALSGFTVTLVLSQLLNSLVRTADAVAEAAILAFLTPFIVMGNVMRLALGQPLVTVGTDNDGFFLNIPRPQD